ncbi:MAG: hypothetical protein KGJ66_11325 [Alphaproteobacteria bacterium]|nr:hypothetical protein [Alphaproteobacteria bacterium]
MKEIGGWIAPWLVGILLASATLFGFLTASSAGEPDTYAAGIVTGFLALVALGWLVKHSLDHGAEGWPLTVLVDRPESLLLLIAVLTAIGIGGLFLAADTRGAPEAIGYALFIVCLLVIAWNLKHYYDRTGSARHNGRGRSA